MESEFFGLESDNGVGGNIENTRESQEKQREQSKKAQAQLQKVQKDEKKAQGDDQELFEILKRFISNDYYKVLIPNITFLLSHSIPSRSVLAMISLFYPDAAYYTTSTIDKQKDFESMKVLVRNEDLQEFSEDNLDPSLRNWITVWVDIMNGFLTHSTTSTIMVAKFVKQLKQIYPQEIQDILTHFLIFFFQTRNIKIDQNTAGSYTQYIQKNLIETLDNFLQKQNAQGILDDIENISVNDLFGN